MEQKAKGKAAKTKDDKNDKNVKMSAVKELLDKGIVLEDTRQGTKWKRV